MKFLYDNVTADILNTQDINGDSGFTLSQYFDVLVLTKFTELYEARLGVEAFDFLLKKGADVHLRNFKNESALSLSIFNVELFKFFLTRAGNI